MLLVLENLRTNNLWYFRYFISVFFKTTDMTYKSMKDRCCIPDCDASGLSHKTLHGFPHPDKYPERFRIWVYAVGGNLLGYSNDYIYKYRRICHNHFEEKYLCRYDRISKIAVPTINMPKPTAIPHFPIVEHQPQKATKKVACTSSSSKDPVIYEIDSKPIPSPVNVEVKNENIGPTDSATYEMDSSPIPSPESNPKPSPCHQKVEKEIINPTGHIATLHSPTVECSTPQIEARIIDPSIFTQDETIETLPSAEFQAKKRFLRSSMSDTEKSLYEKLTSLRRQLSKCRHVIKKQREKIKQSKSILTNPTFLKSMENWTTPAKVLTLLQFRECRKMKKGRRFTTEEKLVALALFKQSPKAYKFLRKIYVLPSCETLIKLLEAEINRNIFTQVESGRRNENFGDAQATNRSTASNESIRTASNCRTTAHDNVAHKNVSEFRYG